MKDNIVYKKGLPVFPTALCVIPILFSFLSV